MIIERIDGSRIEIPPFPFPFFIPQRCPRRSFPLLNREAADSEFAGLGLEPKGRRKNRICGSNMSEGFVIEPAVESADTDRSVTKEGTKIACSQVDGI